jgi:hypothetical protein
MSGLPHAAPVADTYRYRPSGRPLIGAAIGLAIIAFQLVGLAWVLGYGSSVGSNFNQLCIDSEVPPGFAPESPRDTEMTWWPLGYSCEFGRGTTQAVVVPEDSWAATIPGVIGSLLLVVSAGAALTARSLYARP